MRPPQRIFWVLVPVLILFAPTGAIAGDAKETTLRIVGAPRATFSEILIPRVESVSVDVRNAGDVAAQDISVTAVLPDGQTLQLQGPDSLPRNKTATYSIRCYEAVTSNKKITARATCSNCRR
ncbi:MAG TPA: hypothetical protein PLP17_06105 [Oligoflexia bacterium]|nr:hypothetical protein [Oligoflexia bacterium]